VGRGEQLGRTTESSRRVSDIDGDHRPRVDAQEVLIQDATG
jgi:hypothetical protein